MSTAAPARKDFLSILDFDAIELERCLEIATHVKADRPLGRQAPTSAALEGRHVAMLFEKASLRTRSTFEIAVVELGGNVVALQTDSALGKREPVSDVARNLERWVDGIVIRTYSQRVLEEFAAAAPRLRVINALSDDQHPCQALADVMTLREQWGAVKGRTVAYVGDGNNVAVSLVHATLRLGINIHVASPQGYALPEWAVQQAAVASRFGRAASPVHRCCRCRGRRRRRLHRHVDVDGPGKRSRVRRQVFAPYQVNDTLMSHAKPGALFMHCLPAHRGEEVTVDIFESAASVVFDQAENRLHVQKALLSMLLSGPQA